jgi:hypothetical protein
MDRVWKDYRVVVKQKDVLRIRGHEMFNPGIETSGKPQIRR